jgi:hypothetical protein
MGLLETLRDMRAQTLLRESQQQGGGITGADQTPFTRTSPFANVPPSTRMPAETARGYGSGLNPMEAGNTTNLLNMIMQQQQRNLPGQAGLAGQAPRMRPRGTPGIKPAAGGIVGLSVEDFADLHGQEVRTPTLGESINKRIQEQVYEGDKEAAEDSTALQQTVRDFMGGYQQSQDQRIGSAYHPALSGWRGTARDIARGLGGIKQAEAGRAAAELEAKQAIAKTNADTARAQAALAQGEAAMITAENAVNNLKWQAEKLGKEISQEKWKKLADIVAKSVQDYIKARASVGGRIEDAEVQKIIRSTLRGIKESNISGILEDATVRSGIDAAMAGKESAAPETPPARSLEDLLANK